jgi:hypothetical protein
VGDYDEEVAAMRTDPVFVAGLERTGTSLMYALLASHPDIAMTRRTNLWPYFFERYGDLSDETNVDRCLDVMARYKRLRVLEIDWAALRKDFLAGPADYPRLFALLEQQVADRLGKSRWGDKSLHTEQYADEIMASYPQAHILHMMRDPRDRFASVIARWKVRRGGVGAGVAEWRTTAELASRNVALYPDRYRIVRYEDLVSRPEEEVQSICDFVGIAFDPSMLEMEGAPQFRTQGSNSSYGPRRVGVISTDSIGRHASVLSPANVRFIEDRLGDTMGLFGYERTENGDLPRGPNYVVRTYLPEMARFQGWRVRHAWRTRRGRDVPDYRLVDSGDGP